MAVKELERLGNEIKEKFPKIEHVSLHHRIGKCDEMEACVYVGVAGRHRKDLFEACDYGIFELKARVPIWKKEIYYDGSESEWLKNCECTGKWLEKDSSMYQKWSSMQWLIYKTPSQTQNKISNK